MTGKKPARQTFAEIVAAVPESESVIEEWSWSLPRAWITVDGERWHRRGDDGYEGKALHKLLRQQDLLVLHEYDKRTVIEPSEREAFWDGMQASMAESEHSAFVGYQYRGPTGRYCLVVYEFC